MLKKIVFLDRDGVINVYPGDGEYILKKEELKIFPFVKDALRKLKQAGFLLYIISNQACVSKGLITSEQLLDLTSYMLNLIEDSSPLIDGVYYCVHQEGDNCPFRKPSPGLIREVLKKLEIPETEVNNHLLFFIGDSLIDIKCAKTLGIRNILVLSGKENLENKPAWDTQPDYIFSNLEEAVNFILTQEAP